jgi:membrane-bound lytic murein transglycosylase D
MPSFLKKISISFYWFTLALFLSSCANQDSTVLYPLPDGDIASPVSLVSTDPELLLVKAEPEKCLTEELEALRQTGNWLNKGDLVHHTRRSETAYDFPIVINKQVEAYLSIFQNQQKSTFAKWLARSGKYISMFQKELREAGLPEDLAYLAMIESGFNQRAYSRAHAVGLWQFIKSTGNMYNLRIDNYVDERRHAEKSTKAAVAFLSDLYTDFGDWHLAVAGYNAGAGKIRRGLKRYKCDDFWSLAQHKYLGLETKRYVPKLIAAIIIAKNPKKYGFDNINYAEPLTYETLRVGPGLTLDAVALLCDTSSKEIKQLNRELKTGRTPLDKKYYDVQIPVGSKQLAETNLPRLHRVATTGYKTHVIQKGDTISEICRRYNINKTTLLKINNLRSSNLIAGKYLRIPQGSIRYCLLADGEEGQIASNENLILHTIRPGETVSKIAARYNVPADLIVAWNGLQSKHRIRAGQQLSLYIEGVNAGVAITPTSPVQMEKVVKQSGKQVSSATNSTIVLAEQKKSLFAASEQQVKKQVSWYQVQPGDSLWAIARKFELSTGQLKSWNNLKSNLIYPGIRLKINNV